MLHGNWNLRTIQGRKRDKYVSTGLFLSPALTGPDSPKLCCLALWEAPGDPDLTTWGWPFISVLRWQKEQSAVSLGQFQLQTQLTPLLVGAWGLKPSWPNSLVTAFRTSTNYLRQLIPRETGPCYHLVPSWLQGQHTAFLEHKTCCGSCFHEHNCGHNSRTTLHGPVPWHGGGEPGATGPAGRHPESPRHRRGCGSRRIKKKKKWFSGNLKLSKSERHIKLDLIQSEWDFSGRKNPPWLRTGTASEKKWLSGYAVMERSQW